MRKSNQNSRWDFDRWAKRYDETIKRACKEDDWMYRNYEKILKQVVEFAQDILDKTRTVVVDIGIGTGNLAQKFVGKVKCLIGVDPSAEMLKIAKKKLPEIEVREGSFLEPPVEDNSADLVISSYAFHHLTEEEKIKALEEMFRILKNRGKIIIADLMFANRETEKRIKRKLVTEGKREILEEIEEEYYGYVETLTKKLREIGFSTQEKQMTDFVWVICGAI